MALNVWQEWSTGRSERRAAWIINPEGRVVGGLDGEPGQLIQPISLGEAAGQRRQLPSLLHERPFSIESHDATKEVNSMKPQATSTSAAEAQAEQPSFPQPPHLRSHYIDPNAMPWQATDFPGIEMKVLYSDPASGMSTIMFKLEPGSVVPLHEHTSIEQTYMIEGALEDAEGSAGPGSFVWRPGGNTHVARAPQGALFISFFTKPNRFFAGEKFFTEA